MNMDRIKYRYWEHEVWDDPTSPLVAKYTDIVAGCDPTVAVGDFEFCTGLKDKNGNLIYEGDVIFDGFSKRIVEWQGWFWSASSKNVTCPLDKYALRLSKIIGNIHEQKGDK